MVARLVVLDGHADPAVRLRSDLLTGASAAGILGGLVVALFVSPASAVLGFAVSGPAAGVLVPVAFDDAGRILPERSDEVIARVNLFDYIGAVPGAVGVGVLIDAVGAPSAFQLLVVILLVAWVATRRVPVHRTRPRSGFAGRRRLGRDARHPAPPLLRGMCGVRPGAVGVPHRR
ncbi:hypothetical protein AB0O50_05235 [Streptomyces cyaneofuscatus]|uniref:hypothetical protein n=1 Tax=Streptomyces cyaneofuscatus TaxID=66883 RepID=UPI003431679A